MCIQFRQPNQDTVDWIDMGDYGKLDENGRLCIIGRIKDTITLKNAKKVNANIVENMIEQSKLVKEV